MTPPGLTDEQLRSRLDELEAENARLREAGPHRRGGRRRFSWRSFSAGLCLVAAVLLVPVSVVAGWARAELVDEARFVATFTPLADDPTVRAAVVDAVVAYAQEQIDLDQVTDDLFDGIEQLGLPEEAATALDLLRAPAAQGVRSLLRSGVEQVVDSEPFADVWTTALRYSHRALEAATSADATGNAVVIEPSGDVVVQLGPVLDDIVDALVDDGFALAAEIPVIEASIVVAHSDALALVALVKRLAVDFGYWLPLLSFALFAASVLLARRRRPALVAAGAGLAVGAAAFLGIAAAGSIALVSFATQNGLPGAATGQVYERFVVGMRESVGDALFVGAVVAVIALASGSARLRTAVAVVNARIAVAVRLPSHDEAPWRASLGRARGVSRSALVVIVVALVVLLPLGIGGLVLVLIGALLAWWALAVLDGTGPAERAVSDPVDASADR